MTADEKVLRDMLRDAAASAEPRGDAQASRRRGTRLRRRRLAVTGMVVAALCIAPIAYAMRQADDGGGAESELLSVAPSTTASAPTSQPALPTTQPALPSTRPTIEKAPDVRWTPLAPIPGGDGDRMVPATAWTGELVLVAGGSFHQGGQVTSTTASALAFDVATNEWRVLPDMPIAVDHFTSVGVWTGKEFIVTGGSRQPTSGPLQAAAFDPATNRWRVLPASGLKARADAAVTWTGSEVLVWGGLIVTTPNEDGHGIADGAAYRPDTNTWRPIPSSEGIRAGGKAHAWTGTEWILGAGFASTDSGDPTYDAYNPATNTWRRLPPLRPSSGQGGSNAWWNGTQVVFPDWGLELHLLDPRTGAWARFDKPSVDLAPQSQPQYLFDGRNVLFVARDGLRTRLFVLDGTNWREGQTGPLWRDFTPTVSLGDGRLLVLAREQSYMIQAAK